MSQNTEKNAEFYRITQQISPAHATSQYTASSGFGSTASVSLTTANDRSGRVTVTCAGSGQGANPTLAVVYSEPYTVAPHVFCTRGGGAQATINFSVTTEATTGFTATFNGTASGTEAYTFNYCVVG
jgi:hypothetical protein